VKEVFNSHRNSERSRRSQWTLFV